MLDRLSTLNSFNPPEESVLQLVATTTRHRPLDQLPVLPVLIQQVDQKQVVLDRPLPLQQIRTKVVLVVILQVLVVSVCMGEEVLGKRDAKERQFSP